MIETCPHCGSFIPKPTMFRSPVRQRIYEYISKHPNCTREHIIAYVYGGEPDGGPMTFNVIAALIYRMKPTLRANGFKIKSTMGRYATYKLVKLKGATNDPAIISTLLR